MNRTILVCLLAAGALSIRATGEESPPSWADKLTLKGDFRYRIESIDEEGKVDRYRHRIRARAGLFAEPGEDLSVGIQLTTSEKNDPISGNQSLGEAGSKKDVFLDLAYVDWHPRALEGFHAIAGKMNLPFAFVSDLIFDYDLNPEGVALQHTFGRDALTLALNAGSFWVEERGVTTDDAMMHGGQAVVRYKKDDIHARFGVGYFLFENIEGYPVIDITGSDRSKARAFGNASTPRTEMVDGVEKTVDVLYDTGFEIVEVIAEAGMNIGIPAVLIGNYAVNQNAPDNDTAWLAGFRLGKTKEPGSLDFAYTYREIEANAVLGAWTDADYIGGGTDGKGHKLSLGVQLTKFIKGQVSYFMSEKGLDGDGKDYDRLQVDFNAKF